MRQRQKPAELNLHIGRGVTGKGGIDVCGVVGRVLLLVARLASGSGERGRPDEGETPNAGSSNWRRYG